MKPITAEVLWNQLVRGSSMLQGVVLARKLPYAITPFPPKPAEGVSFSENEPERQKQISQAFQDRQVVENFLREMADAMRSASCY